MNSSKFNYVMVALFISCLSAALASLDPPYSARRPPNMPFTEMLNQFHSEGEPVSAATMAAKVVDSRGNYDENFAKVPEIGTTLNLANIVVYLRDWRGMKAEISPITTPRGYPENFPRRISWLYPDDGCYYRAYLMNEILFQQHKIKFWKIFLFGDLVLKSQYAAPEDNGEVTWWYHVALVTKQNNELKVLDPSVNQVRPMSIKEWSIKIMPGVKKEIPKASIAICSPEAVHPNFRCENSQAPFNEILSRFLNAEWKRLVDLELKPTVLLGDYPPWKA